MSQDKQPQPQEQPLLFLDGLPATEKERRRIFGAGKQQKQPRKDDDRATKPLHTDRGFNLMR
jgi:hypothetical protein